MLLRPCEVFGSGSRPARARPWAVPVRPGVRLAVDVGSVRVGVARSDPDGVLASPLEVIRHGRGDRARRAALPAPPGAREVIVALPTALAGGQGQAATSARQV